MINKIFFGLSLVVGLVFTGNAIESSNADKADFDLAAKKPGIVFHQGNWSSALAKAKKERKLIFFDAHAAWCRPCKVLKKRTFTDPTVKAYFDKSFVNVEMDMEKGEGVALSESFGLRVYPTLYLITPKGKVLSKTEGLLSADSLMRWATNVKKANPQN